MNDCRFVDSCLFSIEKLMIWQTNSWMKYTSKCDTLILRLHCDQLLITSDSKVLESLNMNTKIKGIYKKDILILFDSLPGKETRKIKFQITSNVVQCLQELGNHFPVMSYNGSKTCTSSKYRNVDEVLRSVLSPLNNDNCYTSIPLPSDYTNFIRLCLLDPTFPQMVKETEKVLKEDIFKK